MASQHVDIANAEWTSGVPFYGPGAVHQGWFCAPAPSAPGHSNHKST